MREPGAVLLVSCYELGHQPLAVAWAASFLEARGYAPAVMDVSVEPFDPAKVARARVVAVSVPMHTALRVGVALVERVRAANPACHVVAYGLYAHLNAGYLLAQSEAPLVTLVEMLELGVDQPVVGVWTAARPAAPHLARLAFPVPSRAGLPSLKEYARLERDGRHELVGYVEASRGCKHLCRHCPIPPVYGGRFFVVPPDVVLADVRQCVEAGATHVTFGDPDFLNGPRHALAVTRALHAAFPHVSFDVTTKVEHLLRHRAMLPELRELGCAFVVSAVESLSDAVLVHLDKGHSRADVVALVRLMRESGIPLRPTWVAFTPWTTLDDYRDMLDFVDREDLVDSVDPVQYSLRLLVPPGSLLASYPPLGPHLGPLVEEAFSHAWVHPDPRMDGLQAKVTRVVEAAAEAHADEAATFDQVRALADATAGAPARRLAVPRARPDRARPPRLTEPWFC
jgi:hypothetical protein